MIRSIFSWVVLVAALLFICMMLTGCGVPCNSKFQPGQVVSHKVMNRSYIVIKVCQGLGGDKITVRSDVGFEYNLYEVELRAK